MSLNTNRLATVGLPLFLALFAIVGLSLLAFAVPSLVKIQTIRATWTQVDGQVLESRVASHGGDDGTMYKVVVKYRYTVGDQEYESDAVTVGPDMFSSESAEADGIVTQFRAGRPCRVWIDPANPADSVLVVAVTGAQVMLVLIGSVFTCAGLGAMGLALGAFHARRSLPAAAAALQRDEWDGIRIGRFRLELAPGGKSLCTQARLIPSLLMGAGIVALVGGVPSMIFLGHVGAETQLAVIEAALAGGAALGLLHFVSSSRTITVDELAGELSLRWRTLGFARQRQWPLHEITALRLAAAGSDDSQKSYRVTVESGTCPSADLLQATLQPDATLLVAAALAGAVERPLLVEPRVDPDDLAAGIEAVRSAGLAAVIQPSGQSAGTAHELPALLRGPARQVAGFFEKLGVRPPDAPTPSVAQDPAAARSLDPLTIGQLAAEALTQLRQGSHITSSTPGCVVAVFGLIFGGFAAVFFTVVVVVPTVEFVQAQSWPTTDGRVLEVARRQETDSDGGTTYRPLVRYRYTVDGHEYENDRPQLTTVSSSATTPTDSVLARYRVKQTVTVHYDPGDPAHSTLEVVFPAMAVGLPGFLMVFMLVGAVLVASSLIGPRQRRQFKRLVTQLSAPAGDGRVGQWQFTWNGDGWTAHRRPRTLWWIAGVVTAVGAPIGIVSMIVLTDVATPLLMTIAWGLPLAAGLAIGLTRKHETLRVECDGTGQPMIVWTRTGRGRREHRGQWPVGDIVALYLDAKRRTITSDGSTTTSVKYKLQALAVDGAFVSLLETQPDGPAGAVLVAGLAAATGRPLWIARDAERDQGWLLLESLRAAEAFDAARVVDRFSETSWSRMLAGGSSA